MKKIISVPDIGTVLLLKKTNATRIKLRIHPEKGISVTIPYQMKFDEGEKFLYKNIDWLRNNLEKQTNKKLENLFSPSCVFITRKSEVKFILHNKNTFTAKLDNHNINFYYNPDNVDFNRRDVQRFISKFIVKSLQVEASDYLINKAFDLADKVNIKFNEISVGTAETRWGSCSNSNNIILSCRLMLLPDVLIDYIILHELCHVIHKNHGLEFHALLDKLVGGKSKELNKMLKQYSTRIIPGNYRYN
jgi:predicted metal-dependent hydrolase